MKAKHKLLLCLLSAALLSAGWLGITGMVLPAALVPLLFISGSYGPGKKDFRKTFGWTALCFGLWSGMTTWWIWFATPVGPVLSILITVFLFGGIFMVYHYVSKRAPKPLAYTILVAGWIACEYLYTVGEVSFPWLIMGNGFANDTALVQWYDTTGVFGGTLWVLILNLLIYESLTTRKKSVAITALGLIIIPISVSLAKYFSYRESGSKVKVELIQPNLDPYMEKFAIPADKQFDLFLRMASRAPGDVDYIVFPETSLDDRIWENNLGNDIYIDSLKKFAAAEYPGAQIILGAMTFYCFGPGEEVPATARTRGELIYNVYNSAIAVDSSSDAEIHHKSKLVVGAEKMPYYRLTRHLESWIVDLGGTTGQLGYDTVRKTFAHPAGIRSAAAICYESVYGEYYGEFVRNGAQVMFIITNDGWWEDTPGYRQHFSFARLRAIETRRSIGRSANTGISGFIDQRGRILSKTRWDERTTLTGELTTNDKLTFYVRYGDYIARVSVYVLLLSALYYIAYRIRRKQHLVP